MLAVNHPSIPEQDPRYSEAIALHQAGKPKEAIRLYHLLYQRWPYHAHLLASYGTCKMQIGDLSGGLPLLEQALSYDPTLTFALTNRASALSSLGRYEDALSAYDLLPATADNLAIQGTLLAHMHRYNDALYNYNQAISINPDVARYHHDKGSVLAIMKHADEAIACYNEALRLNPRYAEAYYNRARMLHEQQHLEDAVINYNAALAIDARYINAYAGLCSSLVSLNRLDEALRIVDEALTIQPVRELYLYKAIALYQSFDYEGALACTDHALSLDSNSYTAWAHRGYILMGMHRHEEAKACYDKALALNPSGNDENWAYALLTLASGDFMAGWPRYEWRWRREEGQLYVESWPKAPRWLGSWSIQGKTLLVLSEQGMGDTLQFCRFVPHLIELGARVKLVVQKPLVNLLRSLHPEVEVMTQEGGVGGFDFFTPLLSLPMALKITLHTIPCRPYLTPPIDMVQHWKEELGIAMRPRIGLAWSGNPNPKSDHKRTIPLAMLAPLLNQDADFYVLQRDIRPEDDLTIFPNLHHIPDALDGFDQTAALAVNMDSIITIDTSITHLVGALGLPTTVLLPYHACFRWLTDRDDSPWYPSMRLIRQTVPGNWETAINQLTPIDGEQRHSSDCETL